MDARQFIALFLLLFAAYLHISRDPNPKTGFQVTCALAGLIAEMVTFTLAIMAFVGYLLTASIR